MKLTNKLAVVVGASGGLGREFVMALAKEGVNLILVARRKAVLKALKKEISGSGVNLYIFTTDVSRPKAIIKLSNKLCRKFKTIDLLFNAAGIGVYEKLEDITLDAWQSSFALNTTAPFLFIQKLMPALKNADHAVVVSLGSGMGKVGLSGRAAYCASKFALRGLVQSLSKEYKKTNVKICLATLGSVLTSFGPLTLEEKKEKQKKGKKYLEPSYVAHSIISKIKNDTLEDETSIYPPNYFEESKKDKR